MRDRKNRPVRIGRLTQQDSDLNFARMLADREFTARVKRGQATLDERDAYTEAAGDRLLASMETPA